MPRLTNNAALPQPIFDAIARDDYDRGSSDITVTQLISPPRKVELERLFDAELEEDASDRIYSLLGQAIHTILERSDHTGLTEERLYDTVLGWKVGGKFDTLVLESGVLSDYKTAKVGELQFGIKAEREQQLNLLAHLCRVNGYTVNALEAHFILRDWSKVRAADDSSYPQKQVALVPLRLWSPEFAKLFLESRVALHQAARLQLPECDDEERWAGAPKWAAKKHGAKRASKVFDNKSDADAYASGVAGLYVEERPGTNTRCEHYCLAAAVCGQWKTLKEAGL